MIIKKKRKQDLFLSITCQCLLSGFWDVADMNVSLQSIVRKRQFKPGVQNSVTVVLK